MSEARENRDELQTLGPISDYTIDYEIEKLGIENSIKGKLKNIQVNTVKLLAFVPILTLRKIGLDMETAKTLIKKANNYLKTHRTEETKFISHDHCFITTGSQRLDSILEGGIKPGDLTQVFGEYRTGKTQLAHQLSVNVQLSYQEGGLEGNALYIDVDNKFRPERIIRMAKALNLDYKKVLRNIIVVHPVNSEHQISIVREAQNLILEKNVKLLIVDSLIGHFRGEYIGDSVRVRQQKLDLHMHDLLELMKIHDDLVVLITNQVTYDPETDKSIPAGGGVVFYNSSIQVKLLKGRGQNRIAEVVEAPYLPDHKATFSITCDGIQD